MELDFDAGLLPSSGDELCTDCGGVVDVALQLASFPQDGDFDLEGDCSLIWMSLIYPPKAQIADSTRRLATFKSFGSLWIICNENKKK